MSQRTLLLSGSKKNIRLSPLNPDPDNFPQPRNAHRPPRTAPTFARIIGLETEYAILYQPDDPGDDRVPPFSLLEKTLFEAVLHGRKCAKSSGVKGGYFLENGGLVHLELYVQRQSDTPILEVATPECSNPDDLVIYQRAFDRILSTASDHSWCTLNNHGYRGRIAFGKNNLDSSCTGYGCHENYLVRHNPRWYETLGLALCTPFLFALALPWMLSIALLIVLLCFYALGLALLAGLRRLAPPIGAWLHSLGKSIYKSVPRSLVLRARVAALLGGNALLFPFLYAYSAVLRWIAYPHTIRQILPFLISRQVFAGSGHLNPSSGHFELSQRAVHTRSVSSLIMFGRHKTMVDLKSFLRQPLSIFTKHRRLAVTLGDSNPSDVPNLLKIGVTTLLLEMIESGMRFDLRLRSPVNAFREISLGGPWKQVRTKGAGRVRATALEIQHYYLNIARDYLACFSSPEIERYHEIVELWAETLQLFEDNPSELSTRLDWSAKKALLDRAILSRSNWTEFGKWVQLIRSIPDRLLWKSNSLAEILDACTSWRRWIISRELNRQGLLSHDFSRMRKLYFQCRKIDLRYHEISCDAGYQRQLETEGLIDRCVAVEAVQRATREPPSGTRARVRGYYIKLSPNPESMYANWGEIRLPGENRVISLSDPFHSEIPTD